MLVPLRSPCPGGRGVVVASVPFRMAGRLHSGHALQHEGRVRGAFVIVRVSPRVVSTRSRRRHRFPEGDGRVRERLCRAAARSLFVESCCLSRLALLLFGSESHVLYSILRTQF